MGASQKGGRRSQCGLRTGKRVSSLMQADHRSASTSPSINLAAGSSSPGRATGEGASGQACFLALLQP